MIIHPRMATPTSLSPSFSPSSIPDDGGNDKSHGVSSSNLYLITFLATLFILLFVACAIVFRSILLRRRFRRRIDEAMAAGIILAPRAQGSRKRRFGTKPKFHDAWIMDGGQTWDQMMPVSVLPVSSKRRAKDPKTNQGQSSEQHNNPEHAAHYSRTFPLWRRVNDAPPTPSPPLAAETVKLHKSRSMLQISVLVAMPSPYRSQNYSSSTLELNKGDTEIPEVVFGVARLPYKSWDL